MNAYPTKPATPTYGADISADGKYRYRLWRYFDHPDRLARTVLYIMLNPSTADNVKDDPTIRRCVNFAKSWGFNRIEVVNLFAYRTSSPTQLKLVADRINIAGPDNYEAVTQAAVGADLIVAAWGAHGTYQAQDEAVKRWLHGYELWTFGVTKTGQPKHPLYMPADAQLERFI